MLNIYTNTTFLTEAHRSKVFPLLFDMCFLKSETILRYYTLADKVSSCDIVIFPIDYVSFLKYRTEFLELQNIAKKYDKPIWIYTAGDYGFTNYIKNSYTFRLGGFNSKLGDKTFVIPSFINDPYQVNLVQEFSILKKENKPTIGFVGHAQSGIIKYLKEYSSHLKYQIKRKLNKLVADNQVFYPSSVKRAQYLSKLSLNGVLNTNFILRNSYRAGAQNETDKLKTTREFYDNIYSNLYTFCIRGVGNFSVRLYETLAVGRIPILLNTDCRLPLLKSINWSEHCLILNDKSKVSLSEQILNFHNDLSVEDIEILQKSNRSLWLNSLRRDAYFLEIYNQFKPESNTT